MCFEKLSPCHVPKQCLIIIYDPVWLYTSTTSPFIWYMLTAEYGHFWRVFLFNYDAFGQYQSSLLLVIDNLCKEDHIWLLFHLLDPYIEDTTVDVLPKIDVVWSLMWHQLFFWFLRLSTLLDTYRLISDSSVGRARDC